MGLPLLSGKVGVVSFAGLSTSRVQIVDGQKTFLSLAECEPNLNVPTNNNYVLFGDTDGSRFWGPLTPAGAVEGFTVETNGTAPTGFAGSITILNFSGNGGVINQTKQTIGGIEVGVATVDISRSVNDIQDSNQFTSITGVTTFRIGAGLTFYSPSTGIVSFRGVPDSNLNMNDDRGLQNLTEINTLTIGAGLSIFESPSNTGVISVTGNMNSLNITNLGIATLRYTRTLDLVVTGIATASTFKGNLEGNVTGNVTGDVSGNAGGLSGTPDITVKNIYSTGINTLGELSATGFQVLGITTFTQLKSTTILNTGIITSNSGVVATNNSFMGNLRSLGISTVTYLQGTNGNFSGIVTANKFVGELQGNIIGIFTGRVVGELEGQVFSSGINTLGFSTMSTLEVSGVGTIHGQIDGNGGADISGGETTLSSLTVSDITDEHVPYSNNGSIVGSSNFTFNDFTLDANQIDSVGILTASNLGVGNIATTRNLIAYGIGTAFNRLDVRSNDGSAGRIDYYCEVSNAHYTRVQSAPHSLYSGNVVATLPVKSGDLIVGDTEGAIDQNIITTGIITAANITGSLSGDATGLSGSPDITINNLVGVAATFSGHLLPGAHNTYDIGSSSVRWRNAYVADMHFSNNNADPNCVDGTTGDWTLQEGDENIFMLNNKTGKRYKINLTEV